MKEKYKPLLVAIMTFTLMLNVVTFLAARAKRETTGAASARAVAPLEVKGCRVEMAAPKTGETVGQTGMVEGTATIPEGAYVWVLERHRAMNRWWPRGGGPARIEGGRFSLPVRYGTERDRGGVLYFAAVVVDAGVNEQLEGWQRGQSGLSTGGQARLSPLRFPETVPGCELAMVAVRRGE